jgi:hypothetical protein
LNARGWIRATFLKFRGEMTHIWQGVQAGQWLTSAQARQAVAGVAGMPLGLLVLPAINASTSRRAAKDRAGSAVAALAKIAQA